MAREQDDIVVIEASVDQSTGSTGPLKSSKPTKIRGRDEMASEEEGTRKGSGVRGSWEGLHCRGHPLLRGKLIFTLAVPHFLFYE